MKMTDKNKNNFNCSQDTLEMKIHKDNLGMKMY